MNHVLKIATINLNSTKTTINQNLLRDFIWNRDIDLVFLQELCYENFSFLPSHFAVVNINEHGMGTGILLRKLFEFDNIILDPNGRISSIVINRINYINIYAYSGTNRKKERDELFINNLAVHLSKSGVSYSVLGGDFNCVLERSDCSGVFNDSAGLRRLVESFQWKDVTKELKKNQFTFFRSGSASRLDRFYGPTEFVASVLDAETLSVPFSDHCAVILKVKVDSNNLPTKGRGYWKINSAILNDNSVLDNFAGKYNSWKAFSSYCASRDNWWNCVFKNKTKQFFKSENWSRNQQVSKEKSYFYSVLNDLHNRRCRGEDVLRDMKIVKSRLMEIENERMKYFCSTVPDYSMAQKENISIFQVSSQIQRYSKAGNIRLVDRNVITGDVVRLKQIIFDYFSTQFETENIVNTPLNLEDDPLNHVRKSLTAEQQRLLIRPITEEEIFNTLKSCKKKKSPGPDGLNYEFYIKNFEIVKEELIKIFNDYLVGAERPPREFSAGVITLIHKRGSKHHLENYRPISLLNCDYKLFTKIIANRISPFLEDLLSAGQTACLPQKSCTDNLKDIRRILLRSNDTLRFKGALVSVDLQKAFDKVDHNYLWKVLRKFNLPEMLIECIQNLYRNAYSKIQFNGFLTNDIKINCSVRQGCPLSMLLFVLYVEPLLCKINNSISGVLIYDKFIKTIAYADDINIFIKNDEEFDLLIQILHSFESFGKIEVNVDKSAYMRFNRCVLGPQQIPEVNCLKILGVQFSSKVASVINNNYDRIIQNVKRILQVHSIRNLNLWEKSWFINAFVLSKFWYLAQVFPPTKRHIAEIKSCIGKFFWSGFIFKTNREQLYLDYDQGGLRLVDPESKTRALFIKNALDWGIPNSSEEYIIKNLKTQNLPLAFKELIVETKKIKEMSDISTTASIYRYYISQKNIIPAVRFDYPTIQ